MDERNDIIDVEEVVNEVEEGTNESSGIGTGLAMLIGAGITVAGIVIGRKVKKVVANYKAKKELKNGLADNFDDDGIDETEIPEKDDVSKKKK